MYNQQCLYWQKDKSTLLGFQKIINNGVAENQLE